MVECGIWRQGMVEEGKTGLHTARAHVKEDQKQKQISRERRE